jgi:hypothetical protein
MAQHALDEAMAGVRGAPRSAAGGGWKQLFWFAVAAAGLGFAGYVYFVPYHQIASALDSRSRELSEERKAGEMLTAERDRLKAGVGGKLEAVEPAKGGGGGDDDGKRAADLETIATQLKTPLEELGAVVATEANRVTVSLADRAVDKNGIDVSSEGNAVLRILAGTVKKTGSRIRIKARFGSAPAPKQLRSLFGTVGEVSAVRAARVMSVLQGAGVAPERLSIVGEAEKDKDKPKPTAGGKGKRSSGSGADRLDIEVEP